MVATDVKSSSSHRSSSGRTREKSLGSACNEVPDAADVFSSLSDVTVTIGWHANTILSTWKNPQALHRVLF